MQKARSRPARRHGASTACRCTVSGSISLPCQGFFSPFPHGTSSLSVARTYLALRHGRRSFPQGSTCPGVLGVSYHTLDTCRVRGFYSLRPAFPERFHYVSGLCGGTAIPPQAPHNPVLAKHAGMTHNTVWARPCSLAATEGIEFSFFSSGY